LITRSKVKKAGKILRREQPNSEDYLGALDILSDWKAHHANVLRLAKEELASLVVKIEPNGMIASREKRAKSIVEKLRREPNMSLDKMQDVGGCRGVLKTHKDVNKVAKALRRKKYIRTKNNYIRKPKADGYRGFHLVGSYHSEHLGELVIEFQIRTLIQHAWATAGEITELFTNKAIKPLGGDKRWKEFYKDVADVFWVIDSEISHKGIDLYKEDPNLIARELRNIVGRRAELQKVINRLKSKEKSLSVIDRFQAYSNSLKRADQHREELESEQGYFYIHVEGIRSPTPAMNITHYEESELTEARAKTYTKEKEIAGKDTELVVLVSSTAVGGIRESYPNFFADAILFTRLVLVILKV